MQGKDQQGVHEGNGSGNFWLDYLAVVISKGIPEAKARSYVKWAEQFACSVRAVPLRNRSAEQISNFLQDLSTNPNIKDWQISQASEALKLLYQEFLKVNWATDWPDHLSETAHSDGEPRMLRSLNPSYPRPEPGPFRDEGAWTSVPLFMEMSSNACGPRYGPAIIPCARNRLMNIGYGAISYSIK